MQKFKTQLSGTKKAKSSTKPRERAMLRLAESTSKMDLTTKDRAEEANAPARANLVTTMRFTKVYSKTIKGMDMVF